MDWFDKHFGKNEEPVVDIPRPKLNKIIDKERGIKALVFSDNHGAMDRIWDVSQVEKDVDLVIHCGDLCRDKFELEAYFDCPVVAVKGNCDSYDCGMVSKEDFELGGYNIMVTHGHNYFVSPSDYNILGKYAGMDGYDVVLFGHIHVPVIDEAYGVKIYNPGSIARPRTYDGKFSYGVLKIDDAGRISFIYKHIK